MQAPVITMFGLSLLIAGCAQRDELEVSNPAGDADRGEAMLAQYQCGVCHVIPGIAGARGRVGPSLEAFRHRVYLAGRLPNDPATLVRFIQDPPAMIADTAMPDVGVSADQARDMAAYLYELE
jgi:cytochrome c2